MVDMDTIDRSFWSCHRGCWVSPHARKDSPAAL